MENAMLNKVNAKLNHNGDWITAIVIGVTSAVVIVLCFAHAVRPLF